MGTDDMSDNARLQKLIDEGQPIPAGRYEIDAAKPLQLKGGVLNLTGVTLAAMPNALEKYAVLVISGKNVSLRGGTIIGDRKQHNGTTGEWGHGIRVREAEDVEILGTSCRECWGDGFYIGNNSKDITIASCTSIGNRRQGLSITDAKNVTVKNSSFHDTGGTRPGDGIDIEPDAGGAVTDVRITGCTFQRNEGVHVEIAWKKGKVERILVKNNSFDNSARPLKIQGDSPTLWQRITELWGDYSTWKQEVNFRP